MHAQQTFRSFKSPYQPQISSETAHQPQARCQKNVEYTDHDKRVILANMLSELRDLNSMERARYLSSSFVKKDLNSCRITGDDITILTIQEKFDSL